jgi:methionyl aminopeptidase
MIQIKSASEIDLMRENALILSDILQQVIEAAAPGVSTAELDELAGKLIKEAGGIPAFLGYRGFTGVICASINDEIVHGIPNAKRILQDGDVFTVDVGLERNGFFADKAETFFIGQPLPEAVELLEVAQESLRRGIEAAKPGNRVSDISHAIGTYIDSRSYSVVKRFVGHGIGRDMHEDPQIPNFGPPGKGAKLQAGMVVAIEPMIWKANNAAELQDDEEVVLGDGWTVVTPHGQLSAHVEDMVLVTENGPEVLTKSLVQIHGA